MASWWRSNLTTTGNNTFMGGEIKMKNKGTLGSLQNVFSSFSLLNILWILFFLLLLFPSRFSSAADDASSRLCCHMIPQVIVTPVCWIFYLHLSALSMVLKTICYRGCLFLLLSSSSPSKWKTSTTSWHRLLIIWQFCVPLFSSVKVSYR